MNVLALDTGSFTGWALYYDKKLTSGVQDFHKRKFDDNGVPFAFFRSWLETMLKIYKPGIVMYEQPHMRGAGTKLLMGFVAIVQELSAEYGAKWVEIHSATLKKYATNNGHATKEEMMEAGKKKRWKFHDDNECDALWLLDLFLEGRK